METDKQQSAEITTSQNDFTPRPGREGQGGGSDTTSQNDSTLPLEGGVRRGSGAENGSSIMILNKDIEEMRNELNNRVVHFIYRRNDRTLREVYGTTCQKHIPEKKWSKGNTQITSDNIVYWDVRSQNWRSFWKNNLFGFVKIPF